MTRESPRARSLVWALDLLFFAGVALVFYREALKPGADIAIHAGIAQAFDFADPHSVTSRIAYPLWHVIVSALNKLGLPLGWCAALVTAAFKTLALLLAQRALLAGRKGWGFAAALAASFALMVVTGLRLSWLNPYVYRGVGAQNVWHNPTQVTVTAAMLACLPYLARCWRCYERAPEGGGEPFTLPWRKVALLSSLLALTLFCKPTFMQALLPAAFALFFAAFVKNVGQWRYFMQIVLAFLPSVGIFLIQYLYYTGVLVEFTSGVMVCLTAQTLWVAVRSALIMCAFPLLALVCGYRRGQRADFSVKLALAMLAFSVLEAASFHETGMRLGHGNFTWSTGTSALYLWLVALRGFGDDLRRAWRSRETARLCGFAACLALLLWHVASGCYYVWHLLSTASAF